MTFLQERVREMVSRGINSNVISEELGCSLSYIRSTARKAGLKLVRPPSDKAIDITLQTFGRLVAIHPINQNGRVHWFCTCVCGGEKVATATVLRSGRVASCGCRYHTGDQTRTHDMSRSSEYKIWRSMKARCTNPKTTHFRHYGGRGISVCQRWIESFENFIEDMGLRPSPELSIDRINNDGNYEPGNCRWATRSQQMKNRRPRQMVVT